MYVHHLRIIIILHAWSVNRMIKIKFENEYEETL